jgi:hypothetical protein
MWGDEPQLPGIVSETRWAQQDLKGPRKGSKARAADEFGKRDGAIQRSNYIRKA